MSRKEESTIAEQGREDLIAYCGLYCGDCAGYTGEIAIEILQRYKFKRTAAALFSEQLAEHDRLWEMLQFISGLRCEATCREREEPCKIARCCIERGFHGCYECGEFETCTTLAELARLHGDSCPANLRAIKEMGPAAWAASGR